MELKLQSKIQCQIADLLWEAQSFEEVDKIIRVFGHDARVVYNMMMAATYDQIDNTHDADRVIQQFRLTR
jgi:hypothetical protein